MPVIKCLVVFMKHNQIIPTAFGPIVERASGGAQGYIGLYEDRELSDIEPTVGGVMGIKNRQNKVLEIFITIIISDVLLFEMHTRNY